MREGRASDLVIISPLDLVCWILLFHLEMDTVCPEWEMCEGARVLVAVPWEPVADGCLMGLEFEQVSDVGDLISTATCELPIPALV